MKAGEVYAIDLARVWPKVDPALKGKHVVAWCAGPEDSTHMIEPEPYMKIIVTDGVFDTPPTTPPTKLAPRTLLHSSPNVPAIMGVPDKPLPRGVRVIGTLAKLPRIPDIKVFSYWAAVVMSVHYSWQREHEPAPAPVVDARKPRPLDPRKLLPRWTGSHAKVLRALLRDAIASKVTKARMRKLVEAINAYNDENGSFIDTAEREVLMESLESIAAAHGLGMLTKQLDAWRDW